MADPLSLIPSGKQYNELRWTLAILKRDFPDDYAGLSNQDDRILGWVDEIETGSGRGRDADQIRDDIVLHVMDPETTMETYGISREEFDQLVLGGNEGGINFADLAARGGDIGSGGTKGIDAGGTDVSEGTPEGEEGDDGGVGRDDGDPDTPDLTIMTSEEMNWFFDRSTGTWMVEYGLPNSNRTLVFEADSSQMDALFGEGFRPNDYKNISQKDLLARGNVTFGGNIAEVEGTGAFEGHVERVISLALDEGRLPEWAQEDGVALDIIFTAQSEGKSNEWVVEQLSKTSGFKKRFPKIQKFVSENNLTLTEGIAGFLEFEAGVTQALQSTGQDINNVNPDLVGDLLDQGHSLKTVQDTAKNFRRMKEYQPAIEAFNQVLTSQGHEPITKIQDMLNFVSGRSSAEIYDLYEQSSIQEAAVGAGLGDIFSVQDAIHLARGTDQTLETATQGMQKAAELLLRMRHEVDTGKFGLDHEELIDISLGQTPRSGRSQAEIFENVNRAVLSAQGELRKKAQPFKSFSESGTPQAASLGNLRQES